MKKMIIIIFVFIMIMTIGIFVVIYEPQGFKEETPFGNWESDIKVKYADGTTETLGINQPYIDINSIFFQDKEITHVEYSLKAKATGEGYTDCKIDFRNWKMKIQFLVNDNLIYSLDRLYDKIVTIDVNGDLEVVYSYSFPVDNLEQYSWSGSGKLYFNHFGSIRFCGVPDGDWVSCNLPANTYLLLERKTGSDDDDDDDDDDNGNGGGDGETYTIKLLTNPPYNLLKKTSAEITSPSYYTATISGMYIYFYDIPPGNYLVTIKGEQPSGPTWKNLEGNKWITVSDSDVNDVIYLTESGSAPLSLVKTKFYIESENPVIVPYYTSDSKYLGSC